MLMLFSLIPTIFNIETDLCIEPDASADCAMQKVQNMAKIIIRLINDGKKIPFFSLPLPLQCFI